MVTIGFKGAPIFFYNLQSIDRQKWQCLSSQRCIFKNINKASVQAWWVGLSSSMELYIDIV